MTNKKRVLFLIFGLCLVSLLIGFLLPKEGKESTKQTTTTLPEQTTTTKQVTTTTINPVLEKNLLNSIEESDPDYASVNLKALASKKYGEWLIATVKRLDVETDLANVIYKIEGNEWVVVDGPGTSFDINYLKEQGAPEDVINKANYIPIDDTILEP